MKIMMVCRLYSGFESSVADRRWQPSGAPTIFKLIEAIDSSDDELHLVLTCKETTETNKAFNDGPMKISGLETVPTILAGEARLAKWTGRFRWYLNEARQFQKIWRTYKRINPDLIYVDRGNLVAAGFLARLTNVPVVFRVMGISPAARDALNGNRPRQLLSRFLWRSRFALAICTRDGSGGEQWFPKLLRKDVSQRHWFNGIEWMDDIEPSDQLGDLIPPGRTIVLFAGRLDWLKGCDRFIEAFLIARESAPDGLHAVVLGGGPMKTVMTDAVRDANAADDVSFLGHLPHSKVHEVFSRSDIYVSLNRMGNLSNTNLEAMSAGTCIIFPSARTDIFADITTEKLLPEDIAMRIPDIDDPNSIAAAILALHQNSDDRRARSKATRKIAESVLTDWKSRVDTEIGELKRLANN